jgi:transposase
MQVKKNKNNKLGIINLNAAGIDVGSSSHFVAIPADRDENPVREFSNFTSDLYKLADWLSAKSIETIAMESTGVYWIPVYEILESRGFEVLLVNAHHVKNVPGRKSDVVDSQWIQQLHSYGLLRGSFRPDQEICILRAYLRQRESLIQQNAREIRHMQKA